MINFINKEYTGKGLQDTSLFEPMTWVSFMEKRSEIENELLDCFDASLSMRLREKISLLDAAWNRQVNPNPMTYDGFVFHIMKQYSIVANINFYPKMSGEETQHILKEFYKGYVNTFSSKPMIFCYEGINIGI